MASLNAAAPSRAVGSAALASSPRSSTREELRWHRAARHGRSGSRSRALTVRFGRPTRRHGAGCLVLRPDLVPPSKVAHHPPRLDAPAKGAVGGGSPQTPSCECGSTDPWKNRARSCWAMAQWPPRTKPLISRCTDPICARDWPPVKAGRRQDDPIPQGSKPHRQNGAERLRSLFFPPDRRASARM